MPPPHQLRAARSSSRFSPSTAGLPALDPVDFASVGGTAPTVLDTPDDWIPEADAVVITWAEAEWAALHHVFVDPGATMSHDASTHDDWPQWKRYSRDMPSYGGHDSESWDTWGLTCLVEVGGKKVLLFKSNTHLDWPGQTYLEDLIRLLNQYAKPDLLLSIGTAGGARLGDHVGAVNMVDAGTLYGADQKPNDWPTYRSPWTPDWGTVAKDGFSDLLVEIPATEERLTALAAAFDAHNGTDYGLKTLDPLGLCTPTSPVVLSDLAPQTPLLTTSTFVVGTTDGAFEDYAVIEMDDAVIAEVCVGDGVDCGFVRNVSDPVQNAALPTETQGDWGSAVYEVFGLYTSVNGALVTWALLDAWAAV